MNTNVSSELTSKYHVYFIYNWLTGYNGRLLWDIKRITIAHSQRIQVGGRTRPNRPPLKYKLLITVVSKAKREDSVCTALQRVVIGNESIKITVLLSSCSSSFLLDLSDLTFPKNPVTSPLLRSALFLSKSKERIPQLPMFWLPLVELPSCFVFNRVPHGQDDILLKQCLWNTESQDLHLSISPSWSKD